jgi:hypothetical protein
MNDIVIHKNFGQVPAVFANRPVPTDLAAGIVGGFGVVSIRGKAWHIKYRGEEQTLMRSDGDGAVSFIDTVIIRAAPHLSKIFYLKGYVEGSTDRPDCWSANGVTPDPTAPMRQAPTCAVCPQNVWGSKVTPAGKPSRACADSKRIAVVPLHDLANEAYGGPMLLRIPPASLADVANYAQKMGSMGYPYYAVGTRIAFDVQSEYPKLMFSAIRALTDEEASIVAELQDDPRIGRILSETGEVAAPVEENTLAAAVTAPAPAPAAVKAPKPSPAVSAPAQKPVAAKPASGFAATAKPAPAQAAFTVAEDAGDIPEALKRKPAAKKKAEPVPETAPITGFDEMLDGLLS